MADKVTISYVHPGEVRAEFMDSVIRLLFIDAARPDAEKRICCEGAGYLQVSSGPRISAARNTIVRAFLDSPILASDWLLMLDSDMSFEPELLDKLLEVADPKERPIVGGLCFGGGRGKIFPTMYQFVDPKENHGVAVRHITEWPEGSVVQVDATGAACLLVHRSVLEAIREAKRPDGSLAFPEPITWFHESIYKGVEFGEDWTFCLKAQQLGFPIYVNTQAKLGHVKTITLDEELWRTGKVPLQYVGAVPAERKAEAKVVEPVRLHPSSPSGPANRQQRRALERAGR